MNFTILPMSLGEFLTEFDYDKFEGKGVTTLKGKVIIQPEFQRNYIYEEEGKDVPVINTVLNTDAPLGIIELWKRKDGKYEIIDGQQRITSLGRFKQNLFGIYINNELRYYHNFEEHYPELKVKFDNCGLSENENEIKRLTNLYNQNLNLLNVLKNNNIDFDRNVINETIKQLEYDIKNLPGRIIFRVWTGTETEKKMLFENINIQGVPLNEQEILNSTYSGPFVTEGRKIFSRSNTDETNYWAKYVSGSINRQCLWNAALKWITLYKNYESIAHYMSLHMNDDNIPEKEVKVHFNKVIDWVDSIFDYTTEMKGVDWGRLYKEYENEKYDSEYMKRRVRELLDDGEVQCRKGIFEFLLSHEKKEKEPLLNLRKFDKGMAKRQWEKQEEDYHKHNGEVSNCPYCAASNDKDRKKRHYNFNEMEADHIIPYSKGGKTIQSNLQMICKHCNRVKNNMDIKLPKK